MHSRRHTTRLPYYRHKTFPTQIFRKLHYELTPDAERDLREIARYTLRQWGVRQRRRYASALEAGFRAIAQRRIVPCAVSANLLYGFEQFNLRTCESEVCGLV
jgi:hypothetical protein